MKHFCYLILLSLSSYSYGQQFDPQIEEKRATIEFRTGFVQQREGNLHNKVFNGINYAFYYSKTKQKKNLTNLNLIVGNSHLKTNIEDGFSSALATIALNYNYLFKVYEKSKWEIHSGFGSNLNYNIGYYWIWDESHLYWANFFSLDFYQRFSYETNKNNRIILDFSIPVFLFLSRPENERNFKMDDFSFSGIMSSLHYKPEAKFLTSSNFLNLSIEYQYTRKNKFQPFLRYSFNYFNFKTTYSNSAQSIQHLVGLKWNL
jgi:hypothetical protein